MVVTIEKPFLGPVRGFQPIPNDTDNSSEMYRTTDTHGGDDFARYFFGLVMQRARSFHARRARTPTLVVHVILCRLNKVRTRQ